MDNKFILGVLNSKAVNYYFKFYNQTNHVPTGELKRIPFPVATNEQQQRIIALMDKILASKKVVSTGRATVVDTSELESQIDAFVYKLYALSDEEIIMIEKKN